jgi:hypothetical protein
MMGIMHMTDSGFEKIYEQYWLHARHQENQRLSFTNIYAVIVTGVFAFLGIIYQIESDNLNTNNFWLLKISLLIFLIILSSFGYIMVLTWTYPALCKKSEKCLTLYTLC